MGEMGTRRLRVMTLVDPAGRDFESVANQRLAETQSDIRVLIFTRLGRYRQPVSSTYNK